MISQWFLSCGKAIYVQVVYYILDRKGVNKCLEILGSKFRLDRNRRHFLSEIGQIDSRSPFYRIRILFATSGPKMAICSNKLPFLVTSYHTNITSIIWILQVSVFHTGFACKGAILDF